MLARMRRSMDDKDRGFTLIELLVVMIIIGILAAIAIPVFLSQRKKGVDSSMKSDLRSVANEMESYFVDGQIYPAAVAASTGTVSVGGTPVRLSTGNSVTIYEAGNTGVAAGTFCLKITNPKSSDVTNGFFYESDRGGLQAKGTTSCA